MTDLPNEGSAEEAGVSSSPRPPGAVTPAVTVGLNDTSPWAFRRRKITEGLLTYGTGATAVVPGLVLAGLLAILLVKALPAIRYNGAGFFTSSLWSTGNAYSALVRSGGVLHPAGAHYGAFPIIAGTLETSAIALVVAMPIAIGAAILLVEKLPRRPAAAIGLCLEVLAGIPSVVIGLWGVLTFGPWLAQHVYPGIAHYMPNVPVLNIFKGETGGGEGLLTTGLVLGAMIIPIIATTTRDLLRQVPGTTKEGAEALGMTEGEAFRTVQLRWIRTGIVGAAVLGLGRALGETIAIALVSGSSLNIAPNIYGTVGTIAATILSQLDSALGDASGFGVDSLAEAALVLFLITLIVNIIARVIVKKSARGAALPVGAGF